MSNAIYIIAYHGNDPETRQKRSDNHNKQIEWWLDYDDKIEIRILAQDFSENEYWDNDRVTYVDRLDSPTPPASARNILLNHFYDTDEEWAVFADSDAILREHDLFELTSFNICDIIRSYPEAFENIDLFSPHNDQRPGDGSFYKKYNKWAQDRGIILTEKNKKQFDSDGLVSVENDEVKPLETDKDYKDVDWENELVFDRKITHLKGTMFFLKNNKERFLMDEYFNVHPEGTKSILGGEDDSFIVQLAMANKGTYMLRNIILKEFTAGSTWSDTSSRKQDEYLRDKRIAEQFGLPSDRSKWTKYIKQTHTGYPPQLRINTSKVDNFSSLFD